MRRVYFGGNRLVGTAFIVAGSLTAQPVYAQTAPAAPSQPDSGTVNIGTVPVTAQAPEGVTIGQQPDAEGIKDYVTTRSRTGGKADLPDSSVAQDIVVVPQKVIQDQWDTNVREALENVAGTSNSGYSRNGQYDGFGNIRGFPASTFLRNGYYDESSGINIQIP